MLAMHGVTHLEFYVLNFRARRRVKMWKSWSVGFCWHLRKSSGDVPRCNVQGQKQIDLD